MANSGLRTMNNILDLLPDTGITGGAASNLAADWVAAHPEVWIPVVLLPAQEAIHDANDKGNWTE